jgi:hypothetical protein
MALSRRPISRSKPVAAYHINETSAQAIPKRRVAKKYIRMKATPKGATFSDKKPHSRIIYKSTSIVQSILYRAYDRALYLMMLSCYCMFESIFGRHSA